MNNMDYKEYVAKVIDEEGKELSIKTYAVTMQEALDNIVLMPTISHLSHLSCKVTDENWIKKSNLELSDLRKVRSLIDDEKKLLDTLINKEKD